MTDIDVLRNKMVVANLGLARMIAHQYKKKTRLDYDDLFQIACIGLIKASSRFDPSRGIKFSSFAVKYLRGEILHYLRDKSNLVRNHKRTVASLDKEISVGENKEPLVALIESSVDHPAIALQQSDIEMALAKMDRNYSQAIRLVYLEDKTKKEAGEILGISFITCKRWEAKGIQRLKGFLKDYG